MISQVKFFKDAVPLNWLLSEAVRVFHDSFSTQKECKGLFLEISATFQVYFGATILVISFQRQGSNPPNFAILLGFSYIKNMLKIRF